MDNTETTEAGKKVDTGNIEPEKNNGNGTVETETAEKKVVPLPTFISEKKKRQELEVELDKLKAEQKKIEEDKLKEDGKLQELIQAKEKELEEKENLISDLKMKADAFEEFRQSKIKSAQKILGDNWIDDYSKLSIEAIDRLTNLAQTKPKPSGDGGPNADLNGVELTPEQKKEAHSQFPQLSTEKAEKMWRDVLIKRGKIKTE